MYLCLSVGRLLHMSCVSSPLIICFSSTCASTRDRQQYCICHQNTHTHTVYSFTEDILDLTKSVPVTFNPKIKRNKTDHIFCKHFLIICIIFMRIKCIFSWNTYLNSEYLIIFVVLLIIYADFNSIGVTVCHENNVTVQKKYGNTLL